MWGKEARCVRYFDPSPNYPNFHLRGLVRDVLAFDVAKGPPSFRISSERAPSWPTETGSRAWRIGDGQELYGPISFTWTES
jgi:hypothetical protein